MRPSRRNYVGIFFSLVGFIFILLCLVGCRSNSGAKLYFAQLTERPAGTLSINVGWQGYCITDRGGITSCRTDDGVMMMPFDVTIPEKFNETFPELFTDEIEQDPDLNPASQPNPPHNPKIYPASVLCLLCGGAATLIGLVWAILYPRFQDQYYSRGFLAWGAAVLALLLVAQSSIMYENGVDQLNLVYPHLEAVRGPCLVLSGMAFACFAISGYTYLHGCFSKEEDEAALGEGYNPL
ncbi:hypothetical protein BDB00DRAFT_764656 [Zychaea mexicana]|uniref:uncharacterized protein n=1 Tax=Zychaea mexicana TaxID=64656 RepID=UPI0022FF44DB|nr:uncharacterized protein BDB00DRAFT_764656 [Zychaea mexicana]KAI9492883.1 hypothetical protein BDB00DRAFT_764656 [Zychaea mexicana]